MSSATEPRSAPALAALFVVLGGMLWFAPFVDATEAGHSLWQIAVSAEGSAPAEELNSSTAWPALVVNGGLAALLVLGARTLARGSWLFGAVAIGSLLVVITAGLVAQDGTAAEALWVCCPVLALLGAATAVGREMWRLPEA